ncbi:MAG: FAD-dependent oxidoreductase [Mesorhizobium sp.]|nr:MAG: FAD-dependent oxidoreductase [Mesorhizobium sp.]
MVADYHYIIVGAGSAGCVLARRLTDTPTNRVLLVEAGPEAKDFWIRTPAGMARMMHHPKFNWNFETEPVPTLEGRTIYWPRGKALGGSSAINGMVHIRGDRRDYDHWEALGNPGWAWNRVGKLFDAMENDATRPAERRSSGPLDITHAAVIHPTVVDFIAAGNRFGLKRIDDINAGDIEGIALQKFNIRNGRRQSSYDAYLAPVRHRRNLTIMTNAQVTRILIENSEARGIEAVMSNGQATTFQAAREVILCAGALCSPQLLMVSGVGNPEELKRHGIDVRHALPGVGENLQDHFVSRVQMQVTCGSSYNRALRGWRKYAAGAQYLLTRSGYLALGSSPAVAFIKSSREMDYADVEISFRPMTFSFDKAGGVSVNNFDAMSASIYRVRPTSRGRVGLHTSDPRQPAKFEPNYLATDDDAAAMIAGIRAFRAIAQQSPLRERVVSEMVPGPDVDDDQALIRYMRREGQCAFHPAGTCKMGVDPMAVVDSRLRVHGIERLRVADASIMPVVASGNTNAATLVIGENAARMIMENAANS